MITLGKLDRATLARLTAAADQAIAEVEAELDAQGETLGPVARELLAGKAVADELARINTERFGTDGPRFGEPERRAATAAVAAELFGVRGVLGALLARQDWDEIDINSHLQAFITWSTGAKERIDPPLFGSEEEYLTWAQTTARRGGALGEGETISAARPRTLFALPGGIRCKMLWGGEGQGGPATHLAVCFRRQGPQRQFTLDELIEAGMGSPTVGACLAAIVAARFSVFTSGTTGAGKTTLTRAMLLAALAGVWGDRVVQVETVPEFCVADPTSERDVVELVARPPNIEGRGEITVAELVEETTTMKPDRISLGEIKGPSEAAAILNALSNGHRGSLATIHALSATAVPLRLKSLCGQPPANWSAQVTIDTIATSVDFIVHLELDRIPGQPDRRRYVSTILEVVGADGEQLLTNAIFKPGPDGRAVPGDPMSPDHARALAQHGYHHLAGEVWQ